MPTRLFAALATIAIVALPLPAQDAPYGWTTAGGRVGRGINGIHLYHDGSRWWITHATWDSEREDSPIPAEYLP